MFYVYCLFRPWNGEPCYIGKGTGERYLEHFRLGLKHPNSHLRRIIQKAAPVELPVVILHEGLDELTALEYERALIAAIGRTAKGGPLANQTDGGEGVVGLEHSTKSRLIMSERALERWKNLTPEQKQVKDDRLRALAQKNKEPERRALFSAQSKGIPKSAAHNAAVSAAKKGMPGRKHTPEERAKCSEWMIAYHQKRRLTAMS